MNLFEVGLVYQKANQLFLAVESGILVGFKNGEKVEVRPTTKYSVVRSISVEALSEHWGIGLDEFDAKIGEYLGPSPDSVKSRPRGQRRSTASEDDFWKRSRTGRIARPRA